MMPIMANINQCDQSCDIIKRDTEENDSGGLGGRALYLANTSKSSVPRSDPFTISVIECLPG